MMDVLPVDVIKIVLANLAFEDWLSVFLVSKLLYQTAKKSFDPSVDNNRALRFAIRRNFMHLVIELLEGNRDRKLYSHSDKRVNPNSPNSVPLLIACTTGNAAVVKLLLSRPQTVLKFDIFRQAVEKNHAVLGEIIYLNFLECD
jgi:ankyrin repeat protein